MTTQKKNADDDDKRNRCVGRRRRKYDRAKQHQGDDDAERYPMQPKRLEIETDRPRAFLGATEDAEEHIKNRQTEPAGQPAAGEFAEDDLPTRDGLGEQREDRPLFTLGR